MIDKPFIHLHMHSQFSVLQATPDIKSIVSKAKALNMPALALTDLGNMYGAFKFVREALNHEIKPIVGCELYVAEDRLKQNSRKTIRINDTIRSCWQRIKMVITTWPNSVLLDSSKGYMEFIRASIRH